MAFADGELDADTAAAVASAIQADPALGLQVEQFNRSRIMARAAFADILSQPVPDRLVQSAQRGDGWQEDTHARRWALGPTVLPLAAGMVLAIGLGGGLWWLAGSLQPVDDGWFRDSRIVAAQLASQPSGLAISVEVGGGPAQLTILGSYRIAEGVCRSYRLLTTQDAIAGVGCDRGDGFVTEIAVVAGGVHAGSFTPASESAAANLDNYLDSLDAEGPLTVEEEASLFGR
jgi:hypothetical protein